MRINVYVRMCPRYTTCSGTLGRSLVSVTDKQTSKQEVAHGELMREHVFAGIRL